MSSLLTNEFYEHLYKLEQYNSETTSWTSVVKDDNPDLLFCQNFTKKYFNQDDLDSKKKDKFIEKVRDCFSQGITDYSKIASAINKKPMATKRLIEKYNLSNELEYAKRLWNGVICHNIETQELTFTTTTKAMAKHINASSTQVVRNAISCQKRLKGHRIYKARHWKTVYPSFSLPQEEVLNNEVVRIA